MPHLFLRYIKGLNRYLKNFKRTFIRCYRKTGTYFRTRSTNITQPDSRSYLVLRRVYSRYRRTYEGRFTCWSKIASQIHTHPSLIVWLGNLILGGTFPYAVDAWTVKTWHQQTWRQTTRLKKMELFLNTNQRRL
jgi:hypothetical protein